MERERGREGGVERDEREGRKRRKGEREERRGERGEVRERGEGGERQERNIILSPFGFHLERTQAHRCARSLWTGSIYLSHTLSEARRDSLELIGSILLLIEAHPFSISIPRSPLGPAQLFWKASTPLSFEPFGLAQPHVPEDGPHTPSSRQALEARWVVSVDSGPCGCNSIVDSKRFQMTGPTHD